MNREEFKKACKEFTEKNGYMLNPNEKLVDTLVDGVLSNEEKYGLKLCPCRLGDGTKEKDLELICPCDFKQSETWQTKGRCWCGLFVKRS